MNRVITAVAGALVFAVLVFAGRRIPAQAAVSTTPVCGAINSNTTWSPNNSPYDVCAGGATVGPAAILTIQPGVVVQFENGAGSKLNVLGALSAIGTSMQPITFTGVVATPGSWAGLSADNTVVTPALVNLSYVTLAYGGVNGSFGAQLYADRAVVTITRSLMRDGAGNGLYTTSNSRFDIHTTNFIGNGRNAIQLNAPISDLSLSDLSASGNGTNGVRIVGTTLIHGQRRWAFPGIPYVVDGEIINQAGDWLTIDPGGDLQFTSNGWLNIGGQLKAIGSLAQPITMTAQTQTIGGWRGLFVYGGANQAVAQLDYVIVEYGGSDTNGANIEVGNGQLVAHHSVIRYSSKDGVRLDSNASISALNGQIVSNTLYGVRNLQPTSAILATNNWWGDANGPNSDLAACSSGNGDRVTTGVLFRPVLTSTNLSAEFPLSNAPILTLTPRRWFAPADGTTKVYFDITLHDGNGAPLPGRTVHLHSSIGTVVDGGITDVNGKTLAYLTSSGTGDANVTATLDATTACEGAMTPTAKVTFTTPVNVTDLFPNSPASYFDGDISVTPLPVVTGVTETIHAKLTNPLTVPITVDVSFGFAQAGIGLTFGPIKDIVGQVIPANGSVVLSASFMPIVSGHYCVQVSYNITAIGITHVLRPQEGGSGLKQFNINAQQAPQGPPQEKDSLSKADKAWNATSKLAPNTVTIQKGILDAWWGAVKDAATGVTRALGFDPPRQDFTQISLPQRYPWPPVQPGVNISAARAAALNGASAALSDVNAYGHAAVIATDRYGGASEAHDLQWASEQANALDYYKTQMGQALTTYADRLDNFVQVLINEGETEITITVGDVISYQQRLATTGFSAQEIANAKLVGLTDADIEGYRQGIIAANPNDIAGNVLDLYTNEAARSRELGNVLLHPYNFAPALTVSGGAGSPASPTGSGNTLAQIYNTAATLQIGNPLTQTASIDVRARRIDLPADWVVNVSPVQVMLAPGQLTTITVSVLTGSPVSQGSIPRVAVEGYAGNQLLGGVAVDIVVPNFVLFDGKLRVYLPLLRK